MWQPISYTEEFDSFSRISIISLMFWGTIKNFTQRINVPITFDVTVIIISIGHKHILTVASKKRITSGVLGILLLLAKQAILTRNNERVCATIVAVEKQ